MFIFDLSSIPSEQHVWNRSVLAISDTRHSPPSIVIWNRNGLPYDGSLDGIRGLGLDTSTHDTPTSPDRGWCLPDFHRV